MLLEFGANYPGIPALPTGLDLERPHQRRLVGEAPVRRSLPPAPKRTWTPGNRRRKEGGWPLVGKGKKEGTKIGSSVD